MYQLIAIIFGFILHGQASLILRSLTKNMTIEFEDADASFGAEITEGLPWGNISESIPEKACTDIAPPPLKGVFFALADRGSCNFVVKVLSIQKANYFGAIIVNTESDYIFPMGSDKDVNITIPAIMIGRTSGLKIRQYYLYDKQFLGRMTPNPGTSIEYYLVPLLITLSLAFLGIIIFLGFRVLRNCLRQSKNRLSRDILNKLPEIRFSDDYQNLYDTCAICLEDYVIGDKLRVLPCHHAYHSKCVDRWLLRRQRSCPVCKYRIHRAHDEQDSDEEDPQQTTGEGLSHGATAIAERRPEGTPIATTSRSREGRGGQERPESTAPLDYGNADADNDVAPLLSKSAPVSSWLSRGQLPQQESTWLGYDNLAVEDDDDQIIDRPSRPEECKESQETHPGEVPDVSIIDLSSSNSPSFQPSRVQTAGSVTMAEEMEEVKAEEETNQQSSPLVNV